MASALRGKDGLGIDKHCSGMARRDVATAWRSPAVCWYGNESIEPKGESVAPQSIGTVVYGIGTAQHI